MVMSTGIFVTILEKYAFEFSYLPAGQTETRTIQRAVRARYTPMACTMGGGLMN